MLPFRFWCGCALALALAASCAAAGRKPNILFILTDDQGWPTLSCFGNRLVATPHLDSLARDGVERGQRGQAVRCSWNEVNGAGRSMFVRLGGRVGRLVSAVPNIERPDPVCRSRDRRPVD